jgi:hypothetical protein
MTMLIMFLVALPVGAVFGWLVTHGLCKRIVTLSAAMNLLGSDPTAAAGHIGTALRLNRETQRELKLIIDELRPAALQGKGLAQALQEYADRWQEHTEREFDVLRLIAAGSDVDPAQLYGSGVASGFRTGCPALPP